MDGVSAGAAILGVVDVAFRTTSALIKYAHEVHHASRDRKLLVEEARFLTKLLEQLKARLQTNRDEAWIENNGDLFGQFENAFQDFAKALEINPKDGKPKDKSKFKTMCSMAKWPFSKAEVYSLLQRVERLQQYARALLSDEQHSILERLEQHQQEASDQKLRIETLNWISPSQVAQVHQSISDRAQKGSGAWFLESEAFVNWRDSDSEGLFCYGIPGAGKTVMASVITNHLRRDRAEDTTKAVGVVVHYIRHNDPDKSMNSILGSFTRQLAQELQNIPSPLVDLYQRYADKGTTPTASEVQSVFHSVVDEFEELYVVVDGLDECDEQLRWDLVDELTPLKPKLRLLITARNIETIVQELAELDQFEIKANASDIELFIDHQLQKNRYLRSMVMKSPRLRQDIKAAIVKTADHMFLLARLHFESLASAAGLSIKQVRQKLESLPTSLSGSYDLCIQRIRDTGADHQRIAFKTLGLVSYAFRSLSLEELQHALATEPGDTDLDEEDIIDRAGITALCAGLIVIDKRTHMVNTVHFTARSYLDDNREALFPDFHPMISQICATYLNMKSLQSIPISMIVQQYPLACYAAQYLGEHMRSSPEEKIEHSALMEVCQLLSHPEQRRPLLSLLDGLDLIQSGFYAKPDPDDDNAASLVSGMDDMSVSHGHRPSTPDPQDIGVVRVRTLSVAETEWSESTDDDTSTTDDRTEVEGAGATAGQLADQFKSDRIPEVTALHLAASMGLAKVAGMLLKEMPNIDAVDETGKTALMIAIERGFENAVELLINSGSVVDLRTDHGRSILLLVTERDWHSVGRLIVERAETSLRDDPQEKDEELRFILAVYGDDVEKVKDVLGSGTESSLDVPESVRDLALFLAVEQQQISMTQSLLESGGNVNAKDDAGRTILFRATRQKNEKLIRLLLKLGAEIDSKDDEGLTAWSANVQLRDKQLLGILLEAGADPSTRGLQGVSEAYTAGKDGETALLKFMLESGTNPSIQTDYGWSALHWASYYGHYDCVQLLLAFHADPSSVSDQDVTPLDLAIQGEQASISKELKKAGAKRGREIIQVSANGSTEQSPDRGWVVLDKPQDNTPLKEKVFLCFDKPLFRTFINASNFGQFVYPRGQSYDIRDNPFVYHVSLPLESNCSTLLVRHSHRRARVPEYPLDPDNFNSENVLYTLQRAPGSTMHEVELLPGDQCALPGAFTFKRDWTGSWKLTPVDGDDDELILRTKQDWNVMAKNECRWTADESTLLARSGEDDNTPNICFEVGAEPHLVDLIVCCWISKLWFERSAFAQAEG